jgi:hypothetical protein
MGIVAGERAFQRPDYGSGAQDDAELTVLVQRPGGEVLRAQEHAEAVNQNHLRVYVQACVLLVGPDVHAGARQLFERRIPVRGGRHHDLDVDAAAGCCLKRGCDRGVVHLLVVDVEGVEGGVDERQL